MRRYASARGNTSAVTLSMPRSGPAMQLSDDGDDHAADQGGDDGRVHGVAHRLAAASSDGVGDDDVRAESDADEQVEDESGDRARWSRRPRPRRCRRIAEKLPTISDAGCVEELFQNAGRRHGERESQDFRPYARRAACLCPACCAPCFASASRSRLVVRFRRHCSGGTKRGNRHAVL